MVRLLHLTLSSPMPFGKFKNQTIKDVPLSYWTWLYDNPKAVDNGWNRSLRKFIENHIDVFLIEAGGEVTTEIIERVEKIQFNLVKRRKRSKKYKKSPLPELF